MTLFDAIDAAAVSLAVVVFFASKQWAVGWAVGSLLLFHLGGRHYLANGTLLDIAALQTAMAVGFLLGPFLTVYGRLVGTVYAVLSVISVMAYSTGWTVPTGQGIGINIWNIQSIGLHVIVWLTITGTLRHGRISAANRHRLH
jgi:hypothetical protein